MRHSNPKIETITRELFISPKLSFLESLGVSSKEPLSESQMLSLHFLTQGEIDRFNAHRDSLLATDDAATLSKRLQTLNEVQEIIQSAKNEIEEREDLKKSIKRSKKRGYRGRDIDVTQSHDDHTEFDIWKIIKRNRVGSNSKCIYGFSGVTRWLGASG